MLFLHFFGSNNFHLGVVRFLPALPCKKLTFFERLSMLQYFFIFETQSYKRTKNSFISNLLGCFLKPLTNLGWYIQGRCLSFLKAKKKEKEKRSHRDEKIAWKWG